VSGGIAGLIVGTLTAVIAAAATEGNLTVSSLLPNMSMGNAVAATAVGALGFGNQLLMINAIKLDDAATVSLARKSMDLVTAYFVQICFFDEIPNVLTVSGAALIIICVLLSGIRKVIERRTTESPSDCSGAAILCCLQTNEEAREYQQCNVEDIKVEETKEA